MTKGHSITESFSYFVKKSYFWFKKRILNYAALGFFLGLIIGIFCFVLLQKNITNYILLIIGAFLGVFAEIFVKFLEKTIGVKHQIKPLNRVFGSIAEEDTWIYVSAWLRDLNDLDHSRLFRNDQLFKDKFFIIGTQYVYGKGDAIALSYLYQALEKAGQKNRKITLEDSEQMIGSWQRSAICIGAHNSKTREILDKFSNTFYSFCNNYSTIIKLGEKLLENSDGQKFRKGVFRGTAHDSSDIDYAVILKLKDEYFPEKNIIIIAGLGDTGSAGGAYYLLTHYDQLPYEKETFGVLIEVPSGIESARQVDFEKVSTFFIFKEGL